jgi:hypothetical protein
VITPVPESYAKLPSPPESVTLMLPLALAAVKYKFVPSLKSPVLWLAILVTVPVTSPVKSPVNVLAFTFSEPKSHSSPTDV